MNRNDISKIAHFLSSGMRLGLYTQLEIVKWADKIIEKEESPDSFFVDISLSAGEKAQDFLHICRQFISPDQSKLDGGFFLSILYTRFLQGSITIDVTIKALSRLIFEAHLTTKEEYFIRKLDGDYELTYGEAGKELHKGSFEPIRRDLEAFLSQYKDVDVPFLLP